MTPLADLRALLLQEADDITCYASTTTEYRPNKTAKLLREVAAALDQPRAQDVPRERDAKDYAIEHAGYLVTAADQYLHISTILIDQLADGIELTDAQRDSYSDRSRALRSAMYEFQKRAERAKSADAHQQQQPPEPTCEELRPGCIGFTNGCQCDACMDKPMTITSRI